MAHDTHSTHTTETVVEPKSKTALFSSFWFVAILAGLFIAAINFVKVMSADGHADSGHTEATSNQTMHGEGGEGKPATPSNATEIHDAAETGAHGTDTGAHHE